MHHILFWLYIQSVHGQVLSSSSSLHKSSSIFCTEANGCRRKECGLLISGSVFRNREKFSKDISLVAGVSLKCPHFTVLKTTPVLCQPFVSFLLVKPLERCWLEKCFSLSALQVVSPLCVTVLTWGCSVHSVYSYSVFVCWWDQHFQVTLACRKVILGRLVEEKKKARQMVKENNVWCFILQVVINFNFIS